jgi:hypothetical protein
MNERSLKKRDLGKSGVDFIRQQLLDGGPLSERFLERLGEGHVWEFYFDGRSEVANVQEFLHGGQFDAEDCTAQGEGYIDFLISYLNGGTSRMLLFENQLARLNDPFMLSKTDLFEFDEATYFYYPSEPGCVDKPGVAGHLSSASNYPYIMLAIRAPMGMPPPQRGRLSIEMANEIAVQTEHLLVGAYDGEGYVAWSNE